MYECVRPCVRVCVCECARVCVCIYLVIQHGKTMRHIRYMTYYLCCLELQNFPHYHMIYSIFKINLIEIYSYHVLDTYLFGTALQNSQKFLILKITELHIIINTHRFMCKVNVIFVRI